MSKENLYSKEAKKKIKDMVEDIKHAMFATNLGSKPMSIVPMSTQTIDEEGNIWFLSGADSDHNADLRDDADTQLIYANPKGVEFLSIYGQSTITKDKKVLKDLYNNIADNWFEGVNDPNLTAICFKPKEAQYWDPKSNKYITIMKLAYTAISGNDTEIGKSGSLHP